MIVFKLEILLEVLSPAVRLNGLYDILNPMNHGITIDVMKILIDALLDFEFLIVRIHMVQHIGDYSVLLPFGVVELLQLLDELLLGLGFIEPELLGLGLGVDIAEALIGFALPHVDILRVEKPHPVVFILVEFSLHL